MALGLYGSGLTGFTQRLASCGSDWANSPISSPGKIDQGWGSMEAGSLSPKRCRALGLGFRKRCRVQGLGHTSDEI